MIKDVVIIGAGIIGSSIARELSRYNLNITVLEKSSDVAEGISKANSGIIHSGINEKLGTLKGTLTIEGNKLYDKLSKELDFKFKRNGALILAFNEEDLNTLDQLYKNGVDLGIKGLELLSKEELLSVEKNISKSAVGALHAKTSGIISPYEATIAFAENASENGVEFKFNSQVVAINKDNDLFKITLSSNEVITSKIIINTAGLNSDDINNLVNDKKYNVQAIKGEYCLLDKIAGKIISKTIFQVPNKISKGVLVTPTADGNLLIGPTATEIEGKKRFENTALAIDELLKKASKSVENIPFNRTLNTFAGLRPHGDTGDFIIEDTDGLISLISIESPGLTAAPAIGLYVVNMVSKRLSLIENKSFNPIRKGPIKFAELSMEEKNKLIAKNPSYGKIVCKCELVTEGEIIDALTRPLGARTLDAIKRRTRATMGGCQGLGCLLPVVTTMAKELNISLDNINKNTNGSPVIGFKED